jgi:hypothetical protein
MFVGKAKSLPWKVLHFLRLRLRFNGDCCSGWCLLQWLVLAAVPTALDYVSGDLNTVKAAAVNATVGVASANEMVTLAVTMSTTVAFSA